MIMQRGQPIAVWSLKLSYFTYQGPTGAGHSPESITIQFPLLNEDPFVNERAMRMLEEATSRTPALSGVSGGSPSKVSLGGAGDTGRQQIEALLAMEPGLLPNAHKKTWHDVQKQGLNFRALVLQEVSDLDVITGIQSLFVPL